MSAPAAAEPLSPVNLAMQQALLVDDSPVTEVLLIRHGQQDYAPAGSPRALSDDPPLSPLGRAQATATGRALRDQELSVVCSSGLRRARETADLIAAELSGNSQRSVVEGLREVEVFRSVALDRSTTAALAGPDLLAATDRFRETRRFDAFPTGEPSAEARARAVTALDQLVAEHSGRRLAVVAHGGLINLFLAEVLGLEADMFFFPAHASVTRAATRDSRWALRSANETWQLRDEAASLVTH